MLEAIGVRAFPRIHMTLVDLAGATRRRFGGAGFALQAAPAVVRAVRAARTRLDILPNLLDRDRRDLQKYAESISEALNTCFHIEVRSIMRQHVGLGSKTALLLAVGFACNALARSPLSPRQLALLSGRGGTSGVGVNTTFTGGFVVDGGHRAAVDVPYVPSSAGRPSTLPPALVRLNLPTDWRVHLFLPRGRCYSAAEEIRFFEHNTPIPVKEVYDVMAAVYHGIATAVAEADLDCLRYALREVQRTGFKRREIDNQTPSVRKLLNRLDAEEGLAAGMSSLGPLVYAVAATGPKGAWEPVLARILTPDVEYLGCFRGRNRGYELERESRPPRDETEGMRRTQQES